jgi:valyl-tRNA synthetase
VLETTLRALHPFIPFITEELWQRLPRAASAPVSIALAHYPTRDDGPESATAEADMQILMQSISAARTIRSEHEVQREAKLPLELRANERTRVLFGRELRFIDALVGSEGTVIAEPGAARPRGSVVSVAGEVEVLVGLRGHVDPNKERDRLERKLKKLEKDIAVLEKRLQNPSFVGSAPPEVVAEARTLLGQLERQREHLKEALAMVDELA